MGKNIILDALNYSEFPTQNVVEDSQLVEVSSTTGLPRDTRDSTPIEFRIERSEHYINLSETFLFLRFSVKHADDTDVPTTTLLTTANNLAQSMWKNVELCISDELVTKDANLYPWMSYIFHLTNTSALKRQHQMTPSFWYKDEHTVSIINSGAPLAEPIGSGLEIRKDLLADRKEHELFSQVMFDFRALTRLLPNDTELTIRFIPADTGMCLLSDASKSLKIIVHSAKLFITKVKLEPMSLVKYSKLLSTQGFLYETDRFQAMTRVVAKGEQNLEWSIVNEKMPKRVFLFQIDQNAYNAHIKYNPFNLQIFGLRTIQLFVNDVSKPLNVPLNVETQLGAILFNTVKAINNPEAWDMPMKEYKNGDFLYVVDLTPDGSADGEYRSQDKKCTLRFKLDYAKALTQSIVVFCITETRAKLHLDANRKAKWI